MPKKLLIFIFGIIAAFIFLFAGILLTGIRSTTPPNYGPEKTINSSSPNTFYTIEDTSFSQKKPSAVTQGEIIREADSTSKNATQRFVVKSPNDGSIRELFEINEPDVTFEKLDPQNWSPTNKFFFVYIDYPNRRDVLFMKTDGKFTNGKFYLHSTGLYPTMNVLNAKWIDVAILELITRDIRTNKLQNYLVNFDDDTGIVTPENK